MGVAVGAVLFFCVVSTGGEVACSNQGGASGMADPQQATSLQYCLIDECTISRIDTGERLDVIYTTDNLLVVTLTGSHTSMTITKSEDKLSCDSMDVGFNLALVYTVNIILLATVSIAIVVVHLKYKELRNLFGKLLVLYNLALCLKIAGIFILSLLHFQIVVNSQVTCQFLFFIFMCGDMISEGFATAILAYLAYIVYCSYTLWPISDDDYKNMYKYGHLYAYGTAGLFAFFVVSYDLVTGNGMNALLPDGHCSFLSLGYSDTVKVSQVHITFNKVVQIILFGIYLFYFYKLNKETAAESFAAKKQSQDLFTIAVAMGATVGLSQFIWRIDFFFDIAYINGILGAWAQIIQQCVIFSSIVWSRVKATCKQRNGTSPQA